MPSRSVAGRGSVFEWLFGLDCYDREIVSNVGTTEGISGDLVRDLMLGTIEARFGLVNMVPRGKPWSKILVSKIKEERN